MKYVDLVETFQLFVRIPILQIVNYAQMDALGLQLNYMRSSTGLVKEFHSIRGLVESL